MLLGQVPSVEPFCAPFLVHPNPRLWMRWLEPDRADAELEIAWAPRDEPSPTAYVLAHAMMPDRWGAWRLWRVVQAQGVLELLLAGPTGPDGRASEVLSLPVCADLSDRCVEHGLSVDPFPEQYLYPQPRRSRVRSSH